NNAERTAKGFVQNPLNPHYPELMYRTGDLGHWNARGEIMFLGRRDFQIKHLGYRIELGEIEHADAVTQMLDLKIEHLGYRIELGEIEHAVLQVDGVLNLSQLDAVTQ